MNWNLIAWFAGVLLTIAGIKFVFVAIHTLLSKKTMKSAIDAVGVGIGESADRFTNYIQKKVDARREKKEAEKNTRPTIIIR